MQPAIKSTAPAPASRKRKSLAAIYQSMTGKCVKLGGGGRVGADADDVTKEVCGILANLIDWRVVSDHEPVFIYGRRKSCTDEYVQNIKKGKITRQGILCSCCGLLFLLSKFQVHAGSAGTSGLHRPAANIFLRRDGRSLLQCQQELAGLRLEEEEYAAAHDDVCGLCCDGGELIMCDSCPGSFHAGCLHLSSIPKLTDVWPCPTCRCAKCGCRGAEQAIDLISCTQCQVRLHRGCSTDHVLNKNNIFLCSKACRDVFTKLEAILGRTHVLDGGLSWMLIRSLQGQQEDALHYNSGQAASFEEQLCGALKLLQQCFRPIRDCETNVDVLAQMVFNRRSHLPRLDCGGFYTMLLHKEEHLVSVATIRTHGNMLAEMPFIGTSLKFRQQGMCKVMMRELEGLLRGVGIYKLVVPSVDELVKTWTGSTFKLQAMSQQDQEDQLMGINMLSFPGTTLLHKSLLLPAADSAQVDDHHPHHLVRPTANCSMSSSTCTDVRQGKMQLFVSDRPASVVGGSSTSCISCH